MVVKIPLITLYIYTRLIISKYIQNPNTPKIREKIGVDIGINSLATCSDGTVIENRKAYRKHRRKLARLPRILARKQISKRVYECENCGLKIDRDLNASINLELYPTTDSLSGSKACGQQLNGKSVKDSVKQEINIHPMKSGDLKILIRFE